MRGLTRKRRHPEAATCNAHLEELRRCNDYLLQRNAELNRDNYELATENNKLQDQVDRLTDEHLYLSGENDRLQQLVDEFEAVA